MSQSFFFMVHITNINFASKQAFAKAPISDKTLLPYCREKRQNNHYSKMVHLRKILLAESRGSSRFTNNKVVSDFHFKDFLKNFI